MLSSWYDSSHPLRCLYLAKKYSHNIYDRYVLSFYQTCQVFRQHMRQGQYRKHNADVGSFSCYWRPLLYMGRLVRMSSVGKKKKQMILLIALD